MEADRYTFLSRAEIAKAVAGDHRAIVAFEDLQSAAFVDTPAAVTALEDEIALKADKSTRIIAGAGLSGGGDLSADRTLTVADTITAGGPTGSSAAVPVLTWNSRGQLMAVSTAALAAIAASGSASDLIAGTVPAARMPALTGDVTTTVGTVATTLANDAVTTAKIINDAVTYAKLQNVSATDRLLGRSTAGAGDVEEITCTAAGRALIDDADNTAQRATLGLVIGTNVQAWDADLDAVASSGLATAWTAYTPTVTPFSGSFTTVSAAGRYKQIGKTVFISIAVTITTNGTAAGNWTATLPVTPQGAYEQALPAKEVAVVGTTGMGVIPTSTASVTVNRYDGVYLGADGYKIVLTGTYEAA